jgi:hypothetical protein
VDGVGTAQRVASQQLVDAAIDLVVDGDAVDGGPVVAKRLVRLIERGGARSSSRRRRAKAAATSAYKICEAAILVAFFHNAATASESASAT